MDSEQRVRRRRIENITEALVYAHNAEDAKRRVAIHTTDGCQLTPTIDSGQ